MIGHTLNLSGLASTGDGEPVGVPGTRLSVQRVNERRCLSPQTPQWFLVIEGEVIIDFPHGEFRILKKGDFLRVGTDKPTNLEPISPVVLLRSDAPSVSK